MLPSQVIQKNIYLMLGVFLMNHETKYLKFYDCIFSRTKTAFEVK